MIDLKYTITKFDKENKIVVVTYEDGGWAELRLTNPLPKNIEELEETIKRFAAPIEAIEAVTAPDADLSYIDPLVGTERSTTRFRLSANDVPPAPAEVDPAVEANMKMWEEIEFQKKVGAALLKFGMVSENPATIPVTTI